LLVFLRQLISLVIWGTSVQDLYALLQGVMIV
jgi:hypothetical protein